MKTALSIVRFSLPFGTVIAALAMTGACTSASDQDTSASPEDSSQPDAGNVSDASNDTWIMPDSPGSTDSSEGFDACSAASTPVELLPLDVLVMLDISGSMLGPRWEAVTSALNGFVSTQASSDLGLGLQYFPLPGSGTCDIDAYEDLDVPFAPLSQNAQAIGDSLAAHSPGGETPTLPALQGAYGYARAWLADKPDHTVAVLLATDGEPNVCGSTIDNVAQVASVALAGTPPIRTFVIGVGSELTSLDQVAAAGGSDKAFLVDSAQSIQQQFLDALNQVRGKALSCDLPIPTPEVGTLNYALVNVAYGSGDDENVLPQVSDAEACGNESAWYYDDANGARRIVLCPESCSTIRSDAKGSVKVMLGCQTVVL